MNGSKCDSCRVNNATRTCKDCWYPTKDFCEQCFIKNHSGMSTKNHTTIDLAHGAVILNKSSKLLSTDLDLIPLDPMLSDHSSQNDSFPENDKKVQEKIKSKFDFKIDPENDNYLVYDSASIILPLESIINEEHCTLFESGSIMKLESVEDLAAALKIKNLFDKLEVPIITFISKPTNKGNTANYLLLEYNDIKFPVESDRPGSPICYMIYDTHHSCLVLDAKYMYKTNTNYFDCQTKLMNLLLALSDIIVFSENVEKTDFIRMHEMMESFKKKFYHLLCKVCKANPRLLAPGLVYLKFSNINPEENLETCIKDKVDRRDLFASFTDILDFKKTNFWNGLENILDKIFNHRQRHSFTDISLCINNCRESLILFRENILSNDIPVSWFFCHVFCELCGLQCRKPYDHPSIHCNEVSCKQSTTNEVYFCKICMKENMNKPNLPLHLKPISKDESFIKNILVYPFRRGVVECDKHKIIHDNNWICKSYEDGVCVTYLHKWPGNNLPYEDDYSVGRMVVDKITSISEPASKIVTQSAEYISDFIKPDDWQSTSYASHCGCCNNEFTNKMWKHHCRGCGKVICTTCTVEHKSSLICKTCGDSNLSSDTIAEPRGILVLNLFRDTVNCSTNFIRRKITAITRPEYWENDDDAIRCFICQRHFHNENNPIHHCRSCGKCVCDGCSPEMRTVMRRCIYEPSRICNKCLETRAWE